MKCVFSSAPSAPSAESCYVRVIRMTLMNKTFIKNSPSDLTVQGCIDNLPAGNYTVYVYDVENDIPLIVDDNCDDICSCWLLYCSADEEEGIRYMDFKIKLIDKYYVNYHNYYCSIDYCILILYYVLQYVISGGNH